MLPKNLKLKIIRKVISYVKELTDHNIYHLDLANKKVTNEGHSNILISLTGDIQIIDLDGRSTTYTTDFDKDFYNISLQSLMSLIVDLLFDIDLVEYDLMTADYEYLNNYLSRIGLNKELIDRIISSEDLNYEIINEIVDNYSKIKRLTK